MGKLTDMVASYVDDAIRKIGTVSAVGTVVTTPVASQPLMVIVDGSAVTVPVKTLRGLPLFAGARVVLVKFGADWAVIGTLSNPATAPFATNGTRVQVVIGEGAGECTATTNANAVTQLLPGTLVTLGNLSATNDYAFCRASIDFVQAVATPSTATIDLMVDGVAQTRQAIWAVLAATNGIRVTAAQQWRVPLTTVSAGHTFQLRVGKAAGTDGVINVQATHTNLHVQIFEDV